MMERPRGRVLVVDDDAAVRQALIRQLTSLSYEVRAFDSAAEFLVAYDPELPACLLLDLSMPGCSGLELQERLAGQGHKPPIVFLTGHGSVSESVLAMKGGAVDFIEKPAQESVLVAALERALEHDRLARAEQLVLGTLQARWNSLTSREREVCEGVVAGLLNKQIAMELKLAERTVKLHRARALQKMAAGSVAELARFVQALVGRGPVS